MKRLITLFALTILVATAGLAQKHKDLSKNIAVKGKLAKEYLQTPAGTPIVIRRVVKMHGAAIPSCDDIYYAVEINGVQQCIPTDDLHVIALDAPQTDGEFWQQFYLRYGLYDYFDRRGYQHALRQEIDEECRDYLEKLDEIAYQDDYLTSYVQGVFSKLTPGATDSNRGESLNIRIIQSAEPDAFMLPNGSMVVSTGLLCTLDSEDELAAIIASELGHFVLDHLAGADRNLDLYKQRILLLMRMNKQVQAADTLNQYISLLSEYQSQGIEGAEKDWANKELGWAKQMLDRINRV